MNTFLVILLACFFLPILIYLLYSSHKRSLRKKLYQKSFKDEWIAILEKNVSLYACLPKDLRLLLHAHINYFLHTKSFIGKHGLVIDDEVRISIAGNACLLILHSTKPIYSNFKNIIVYPDTYVAKQTSHDGLIVTSGNSLRLGESWHRGPVVLSWQDVLEGSRDPENGHNVVIHEFAHKLDSENRIMDGLPILRNRKDYQEWAEVLSKEYEDFIKRFEKADNQVIDGYAAVSPIEFFAVASESFFEKGRAMKKNIPDLYEQLSRFYQLDPASWSKRD